MSFNRSATLVACALGMMGSMAITARADDGGDAKKPPMYTLYSLWAVPRAKWADMEKANGADKVMERALAAGTIVGYGNDETIVHQEDGFTHDAWHSAMSMAGVLNALNDVMQTGSTTTSVFQSATKHTDEFLESRYYHWKSGSWKGAYTRTAIYKLKESAPDNAIDTMAKEFIVPLMEKLLADGTIIEYEIDEEALHTDSPGLMFIDFITPTAEGQDKVMKTITDDARAKPLVGASLRSWVDFSAHRDVLVRGNVTYK
jgi:hypothetical protein